MKAHITNVYSLSFTLGIALIITVLIAGILTHTLPISANSAGAVPTGSKKVGIAEQAITPLDGMFSGTIAISEPLALGTFDLVVELKRTGDTITGTVDTSRTQVVRSTAQLRGSITGVSNSGTPTFRITADPFSENIAGRSVMRSFEIVGEVTPEGRLRGTYTETVTGFTPTPLVTKGAFLLVPSFKIRSGSGGELPPVTYNLYLPLINLK